MQYDFCQVVCWFSWWREKESEESWKWLLWEMKLMDRPKNSRWKVDVYYQNSGNIHEYLAKPLRLTLRDKYFFGRPWTKYIRWQLSCPDGEVSDYWFGHSSFGPIQYRYPWGEHRRINSVHSFYVKLAIRSGWGSPRSLLLFINWISRQVPKNSKS